MQESPVHAGYEIPAYAGMTRKLTFYECILNDRVTGLRDSIISTILVKLVNYYRK